MVGEVGIQEELDIIGVPYFGGPQVCSLPNIRWEAGLSRFTEVGHTEL